MYTELRKQSKMKISADTILLGFTEGTMKFCSVFAALVLASCACHAGVINFNGLSGSFATYTGKKKTIEN